MSEVAYSDLDLPDYNAHHVIAVPVEPCSQEKSLTVHEYTKVTGPGQLIQGTVAIVPTTNMIASQILIKLVVMERGTQPGRFLNQAQSRDRLTRQLLTVIPTEPMKPGFKYLYPFVAEFPHPAAEDSRCTCGAAHARFPATIGSAREKCNADHGASIRYVLSVTMMDTDLYCLKMLFMEPVEPIITSYDGYIGSCGLPIERLYTSSTRIYCRRIAGKLIGYLLLTGTPMICDPLGYSHFKVGLETMAVNGEEPLAQGIKCITCCLYRVVYASAAGIGHRLAASDHTKETRIKLEAGQTTYVQGRDNEGGYLDIMVKLPPREELMPPPFVSCHVAVKYELEIRVEHRAATGAITLPLSFGTYQAASPAAPEYSE